MAKRRENFESGRLYRLQKWVEHGSGALDRRMQGSLTAAPGRSGFENERAEEKERLREERSRQEAEAERVLYSGMQVWMDRRGSRWIRALYRLMAAVLALLIIGVLILTVAQLPRMGDPEAPVMNEVVERYSEKGLEETGAVNIVAGMILDYRAFDTLGESNVLFLAVCSVLLLLRAVPGDSAELSANDRVYEPHNDTILQRMADVIVPVAILFGLYIMANGHLSPGGGFSGGAVTGAGLILYLNAHGYSGTRHVKLFGYTVFKWVSFSALSFYCLSKCYSFFTGANELPSIVGPGTAGSIFSAGLILPLNAAVGFVVAFTMFGFYTLFRKGDF